jgi:hypothetical protein
MHVYVEGEVDLLDSGGGGGGGPAPPAHQHDAEVVEPEVKLRRSHPDVFTVS